MDTFDWQHLAHLHIRSFGFFCCNQRVLASTANHNDSHYVYLPQLKFSPRPNQAKSLQHFSSTQSSKADPRRLMATDRIFVKDERYYWWKISNVLQYLRSKYTFTNFLAMPLAGAPATPLVLTTSWRQRRVKVSSPHVLRFARLPTNFVEVGTPNNSTTNEQKPKGKWNGGFCFFFNFVAWFLLDLFVGSRIFCTAISVLECILDRVHLSFMQEWMIEHQIWVLR